MVKKITRTIKEQIRYSNLLSRSITIVIVSSIMKKRYYIQAIIVNERTNKIKRKLQQNQYIWSLQFIKAQTKNVNHIRLPISSMCNIKQLRES